MPRWLFSDGETTYTLPINPVSGGSLTLKKRISRDVPCNPLVPGFAIRMEGRPEAPATSVSGTVISQAHWEALVDWSTTKPVLAIVDDLGRTFNVVITSLQITPAPTMRNPWRGTFTMAYTLLASGLFPADELFPSPDLYPLGPLGV